MVVLSSYQYRQANNRRAEITTGAATEHSLFRQSLHMVNWIQRLLNRSTVRTNFTTERRNVAFNRSSCQQRGLSEYRVARYLVDNILLNVYCMSCRLVGYSCCSPAAQLDQRNFLLGCQRKQGLWANEPPCSWTEKPPQQLSFNNAESALGVNLEPYQILKTRNYESRFISSITWQNV